MKKIYSIIVISFFLLSLPSAVLASSAAKDIRQGNRFYKQGKYDDALAKYSSAQTELPDSSIINFNIGSAMYKKGDFQNAVDAFTRALVTEDKDLEARANYNIANSKYSLGNLKINTDLSGAVRLYRDSLDYYKRAIELNQDDSEARYNHELVEKKLKVLLDRLKNQPEKEKQDGSQDQQSTPESGSEQKKEDQSGIKAQDEKGVEQQENSKKGEGQAVEQSPDGGTTEMSPEEAKMLLDAYGEKEAMQMKQGRKDYTGKVLKDW